ncbi:MAG: hypothetical protein Kow0029_09030 [Candidatus Rifleibacteriota bacterium]
MGIIDWLFGKKARTTDELCGFLKTGKNELLSAKQDYREFRIPKRNGGSRIIHSPSDSLKKLQKLICYRLLNALPAHFACKGFNSPHSIVDNARDHAGKAVLIKIDICNFFKSTGEERIYSFFKQIGWDTETSELLTRLTTFKGFLPQGAPTSPVLSNLVNYRLDARLYGMAKSLDANYTRYADDITFSLNEDNDYKIKQILSLSRKILLDMGYKPNKKKIRVLRQHQQQKVTGLVVNQKVQIPRETRRWLRAVRHRLKKTGTCTLSLEQLQGWEAYEHQVKSLSEKR